MYGVGLNEVINSVLQKDLEEEDARVRREREERRLLALQQTVDTGVIVGTDALVARIAKGVEEKLGITEPEVRTGPVEIELEAPINATAHFPAPPRLGSAPK
jgi:hypothetical protein